MPVKASEDFSFFTNERPGAFFFVSSGKSDVSPMLHTNCFDFNDDLIDFTSKFWLNLAKDRLEL
jgi:hippurate hydrolase